MAIVWHTCMQNIQNIQLYTVIQEIHSMAKAIIYTFMMMAICWRQTFTAERKTLGEKIMQENTYCHLHCHLGYSHTFLCERNGKYEVWLLQTQQVTFLDFHSAPTNNAKEVPRKFDIGMSIFGFSLFPSAIDRFFHLICTICAGREIWRWFIGGQIGGSKPDLWE